MTSCSVPGLSLSKAGGCEAFSKRSPKRAHAIGAPPITDNGRMAVTCGVLSDALHNTNSAGG